MCGILGQFTLGDYENKNEFLKGLSELHHRGPDDEGVSIRKIGNGHLALGHKRLSIIDLSDNGQQPMHSSDSRFSLIFNGEIYNYKELKVELLGFGYNFKSDTDSEVLLNSWIHWGDKCLDKLTGMFAFAIADIQEKKLTLVRDAFGIKPLYISHNESLLSFSSEIQPLLRISNHKPVLNLQRAYDYLMWQSYDDASATFYEGVNQLMPGHSVTYSLDDCSKLDEKRWWWPSIEDSTNLSFSAASDYLRELFLNTIRIHLRSDVPWGVTLSGGIDSSSVVCAIRHIEPEIPIHSFSYIAKGSSVNEEVWIDKINHTCNANENKIIVSTGELVKDLDDLIRTQGEPFGTTSIYAQYRVFKLASERGITVTLDGQGADELLAGYSGYPQDRIVSLIENKNYLSLAQFIYQWSKWPNRSMNDQIRFALDRMFSNAYSNSFELLRDIKRSMIKPIPSNHNQGWIDYKTVNELGLVQSMPVSFASPQDCPDRQLMSTLRNELTHRGLLSLLRHGDRNSMRFSIESRVPFLTTQIAEFILTLPEHYLISQKGETKSIFRHAMRGIVPDPILDRRDKIGFSTPEKDWFNLLGNSFQLFTHNADHLPFINKEILHEHMIKAQNGNMTYDSRFWRIVNLCRWVELNNVIV